MTKQEAIELGYTVVTEGGVVRLFLEKDLVRTWESKYVEKVFQGHTPTVEHPAVMAEIENSERNLKAFWNSCSHATHADDKSRDFERLRFLAGKAQELDDVSPMEAALVDDICENGERELKRHERVQSDNMMQRYREQRKK